MRIAPLPADEWDDTVVRALSVMMPADRAKPDLVGNMLGTFARHPKLTKAYLTFNMHLLMTTTLSKRITETVILRTAAVRRSEYLWDHHVPLARRAGLTDEDLAAIRRGAAADPLDAAVLAAVDELHRDSVIGDATWNALTGALDEQQLMDLVFTAGGYGTLAMAIETFGIEDEHQRS
ncbi:carboxymuconolactone decarboxylase [Mycolicibacterium duvalii]|uniref:Carboxymuconolactone decarboxylase n=1 Tax=Mycolicibacterium duvalii TaxID=39688 RepID=A0A7I7JX09_9MYCO|nr:carboxymuconolactone decarboxylase family protein [Mycolicibacterium duvalii]MCV7370017.1 carboxymuconolactone decarboxylase family protein [Mycolicibacterium duvalii]PEG40761.1 carboxymuconolactone decarboxylase [Mycolicibacterium duvalii]BBX15622.1 carboxymuconolactone decarboxylase [Mycolicibacterium duvalii]